MILCHTESVVSCLPCHIHISLINNLKKYTLILLRPISHIVMALQQFYALRLLSVPGVESDRSWSCGGRLLVIQVQGQLLFLFRGCHQKSRVGPGGMVDHVVRKADQVTTSIHNAAESGRRDKVLVMHWEPALMLGSKGC